LELLIEIVEKTRTVESYYCAGDCEGEKRRWWWEEAKMVG
jgi:hypothetical protein